MRGFFGRLDRENASHRDHSFDWEVRNNVVKICLSGKCKDIQMISSNGFPARCSVRIELSRDIQLTYPLHEIELFVPAEYGMLLEVGLPVTVTLDQTHD